MTEQTPGRDGCVAGDRAPEIDARTLAALRRLLSLPAGTARRVRDETPRRRPRASQDGPLLDLGYRE